MAATMGMLTVGGDTQTATRSATRDFRDHCVFALIHEAIDRTRVSVILGQPAQLAFVATREALLQMSMETATRQLIITEARDSDSRPVAPVIERIKTANVGAAVVAYVGQSVRSRDLIDLVRAGVDSIAIRNLADAHASLCDALDDANNLSAALLQSRIQSLHPPALASLIRFCLQSPDKATSVGEVMRELGESRRTLSDRCVRQRLLSPHELITWCRLLSAASFIHGSALSVERIVLDRGFPSATSFRNLLKRYAGMKPNELRAKEGLAALVSRFERVARERSRPAGQFGAPA